LTERRHGRSADAYDVESDGDEVNLETLMSQVTEYLLTVLSSSRFRGIVQASVPEMLYLLARCMQMTHAQVTHAYRGPFYRTFLRSFT
jgi:hypothetical protein